MKSGEPVTEQPGQADASGAPAAEPAAVMPDEDRPATYREVFASREFRYVFSGSLLSWLGDFLARVALAALVYDRTRSVLASATTLAVSYVPWILGGPLLSALAERYPYRRVMIICDVARMALFGVIAIPGMPVPALLVLLFAAAMMAPPFESARSALLPQMLSGDRYVVGLSVHNMTRQITQVAGYALGGLLSVLDPQLALAIDAGTFGLSALLLWLFVQARPAAMAAEHRSHLLRETGQGFQVVFGTPVLRAIALLVFGSAVFSIVPEGLAAGWAGELGGDSSVQGLIMAAFPAGVVIGGIVVGRAMAPAMRQRIIRPLAVLVPLSLVPALLAPPLPLVIVMVTVSGFAMSLILPANGLFVRALPNGYRARAFGVMQGGLQVLQGLSMLAAGAIAGAIGVARTVGGTGLVGLLVMVALSVVWPDRTAMNDAITRAKAANEAATRVERHDMTEPSPDVARSPSTA
jgi:MFS family permease